MDIKDREASNAKPREKDYKIRDRDNMYLERDASIPPTGNDSQADWIFYANGDSE